MDTVPSGCRVRLSFGMRGYSSKRVHLSERARLPFDMRGDSSERVHLGRCAYHFTCVETAGALERVCLTFGPARTAALTATCAATVSGFSEVSAIPLRMTVFLPL